MRTILASIVLAMGCTTEPTQLVVAVHTDMDVPGALDAFSVSVDDPGDGPVSVSGGGRDQFDVPIALAAPSDLPATFGVAPRGADASREVTVRATAFAGGERLFETRAITSFVENEQLRLDLFLAGRCRTETCLPEDTCTRRGCDNPRVPPGSLAPWTGEVPPDDGGVPVAPGWPRVVGWTDEAGSDVSVTDAVSLGGSVMLIGSVIGHAWLEGAASGPTEVDAATSRVWVSCLDVTGAPCGLELFGSDDGSVLDPRATRDAQGRLLVAATFTGRPEIAGEGLDAGPADRAAFVLRLDPAVGRSEIGLLQTAGGLSTSAIAALASDALILSVYAGNHELSVTRFDGSVDTVDLSFAASFQVVFDPSLRELGASLQDSGDASSPAAAVAGGTDGRTAFATPGRLRILAYHEGEVLPFGGQYTNSTPCAVLAAAVAGDGTTAVTCSTTGPAQVGGFPEGQAGDVWVGLWDDPSRDFPVLEAVLGGAGEEVVLDAAGDDGSRIYLVGRFSSTADLLDKRLEAGEDADAFLFSFRHDGAGLVADRLDAFRSSGPDDATAVAVDPEVGVVLAGRLGAPTEMDGQPLGVEGATSQVWVNRILP